MAHRLSRQLIPDCSGNGLKQRQLIRICVNWEQWIRNTASCPAARRQHLKHDQKPHSELLPPQPPAVAQRPICCAGGSPAGEGAAAAGGTTCAPATHVQPAADAGSCLMGSGAQSSGIDATGCSLLPAMKCWQPTYLQQCRDVSQHCGSRPGNICSPRQQVLDQTGKRCATLAGESIVMMHSGRAPDRLLNAPPASGLRSDGGAPRARQ